MFVSYPVNLLRVRRCTFRPVISFEHVQNFPPDKTDRDACLMYGRYVAYMLLKSIARVSSIRGDEFCHRIIKFCMFCPFSLCNKSVCQSDQDFKFVLGRVKKNILGKGENAGYQHFLLFPKCFQIALFLGPLLVGIVW